MVIRYLHVVLKNCNMSSLGKFAFKLSNNSTSSVKHGVDYYTGAAQPVEEVREFLGKFEGGKIDLTLNNENGIATILLNNPNRRNAITGMLVVNLLLSNFAIKFEYFKQCNIILSLILIRTIKCAGVSLSMMYKPAQPY